MGDDYSTLPTSVTFHDGETEKSFTFTALDDTLDDGGEKVKIAFGDLPAKVTAGTTSEATVSINDDDDGMVTVSPTDLEIDEGDEDTYTVVLKSAPSADVIITVTDPADNTDVTTNKTSLTFTPDNWNEAQTVTVAVGQDDGHDNETAVITHSASSTDDDFNGVSVEGVTVEVTDDEHIPVTVSFEHDTYEVAESDDTSTTGTEEHKAEVKIILSAEPGRSVTVPVSPAVQNGATNSDFSLSAASVTFGAEETEKAITFTAAHDTADDDDESVKITFGALPSGVSEGTTKEAIVSINDDDKPTSLNVEFGSTAYNVNEGSNVKIAVTLSDDPEMGLSITIARTNQDGASDDDYSLSSTSLTFQSGETSKEITFAAVDDSDNDDGESVKLTFTSLPTTPISVTAGTTGETVVSIEDLDVTAVEVEFEKDTYTVAESDNPDTADEKENEALVKVTLSQNPERQVIIPIGKTEQGGAGEDDYSGIPTSLTFESGDTEKSFTFQALHDTADDDGENIEISFRALPTGVSEGDTSEATIMIRDDDLPDVMVSFSSSSYQADEGDTVEVVLILDQQPERQVIIPITPTKQGDISDEDFEGVPTSVTFAEEEERQAFTFRALQDQMDDDGESVRLTMGSLPAQVTQGTQGSTTVAIKDDDVAGITVDPDSLKIAEGSSDTYTVVLETQPTADVTVTISVTGSGDVTASDDSLTFTGDDWNLEQTVTVSADHDDDSDDDSAIITHTVTTADEDYRTAAPSSVTVTAEDDDHPRVTVQFGKSGYEVTEDEDVTVKITLDRDPERRVKILLETSHQEGASGDDYSIPASVTFEIGETAKTFTFTATDDNDVEEEEKVVISPDALPDRVETGSPASVTVTIKDDDRNIQGQKEGDISVNFESSGYHLKEGESINIGVTLDKSSSDDIVIPLKVTHHNKTSAADYDGVPEFLEFPAGTTRASFTLRALRDDEVDDRDALEVMLDDLPEGTKEGDRIGAFITIEDTTQGSLQCKPDNGRTIILEAAGEISEPGERDFWEIEAEPFRVYIAEILGAGHQEDILGEDTYEGELTLSQPMIAGWRNEGGETKKFLEDRANNISVDRWVHSGTITFEVKGMEGGTGTYQIKVRVNDVCTTENGYVQFPWFGGPEGYVLDLAADTSTRSSVPRGDDPTPSAREFIGDNWYTDDDHDWHKVVFQEGKTYTFTVWGPEDEPEEHRLTAPRIVGLFDADGALIPGTEVNGTGSRVTLTYTAQDSGAHYLSVGGRPEDRTGVYRLNKED